MVVKRPSVEPERMHYVVDVWQDERELSLGMHLIVEGAALGSVEFAEKTFPQALDRISPLLRPHSPVHLAFELITCQVSAR